MTTGKLVFIPNEAGEEEGLGHPGIETYKDTPYPSVARECGQNTADAVSAKPALLKFDVISIATAEYPPHAQHLAAIEACLAKARRKKDEKEIEFFSRAREVLQGQTLKVLKISDSNTTGLVGPSREGTPFHSLVKASGVSNKSSVDSGGSFGIGKNAAFAVSELQAVFYSTVYMDQNSDSEKFLAQGKTILISHADAQGRERRATGYWGLDDFQPFQKASDVPAWMRRESVGTSVFVIGFRESEDWQFRIAASILQNFFSAIHHGHLEFQINQGELNINAQTLQPLFRDDVIMRAAGESDRREDFDFSRYLLECLISPESIKTEVQIGSLGKISITVLVRDRLPKRVCIIRNGMAITDNLSGFGDKFSNFPLYKDFVALVEPVEPFGSAIIKRLENPRHDGLSAERLTDERKRVNATRDMKKLAKVVRETIKEQALNKPTSEVVIDELSEFFADADTSRSPDAASEENPETFKFERVARRETKSKREAPGKAGSSGGAGSKNGKNSDAGKAGGGTGRAAGAGTGGVGTSGGEKLLELNEFRNTLSASGENWDRRLYFTSKESCQAQLTLRATGLDQSELLQVVASDIGTTDDGRVRVELTADTRVAINVRLSEKYFGPVELTATSIEGGG